MQLVIISKLGFRRGYTQSQTFLMYLLVFNSLADLGKSLQVFMTPNKFDFGCNHDEAKFWKYIPKVFSSVI